MQDILHTIIFSKDRPMQLLAYLESYKKYFNDKANNLIYVVYKYSSADFEAAYEVLKEHLKTVGIDVEFKQDEQGGFYKQLLSITDGIPDGDIILYGTDDVVFTDYFSLDSVKTAFLNDQVLGFSLRLGENIKDRPKRDGKPHEQPFIFTWNWTSSSWHWGYPHELMATFYRAGDVKKVLAKILNCRIPNDLEGAGDRICREIMKDRPLFKSYLTSVAVAFDINRVQNIVPNAIHGTQDHTPENLLELFNKGYKMSVDFTRNPFNDEDCFVGYRYFKLIKR